ncbi:hypothetical protein RP20_CCG026223 [Aedes albopictus]|nr:hypothetical protein RP20_CCG026223 [Aedes albopictus]
MFWSHVLVAILLSHHPSTAVNEQLAQTVAQILLQHFVHPFEAVQIDQATSNQSAAFHRQQDLIDTILRMLGGRLVVRRYSTRPTIVEPYFFHLIFVDGDEALTRLLAERNIINYDTSGLYLLVISEPEPPDQSIDSVLAHLWNLHLVNANVIFNRNGHVLVYTYFPFRESHCEHTQPELLFNLTTLQENPNQPIFYCNRLRNFHGCALLGGTFEAKPYTIYRSTTSNATLQVGGFEGDLMQVLARQLNFSLSWKNAPGQWGFARPLGNSTGLMKMAQEEDVDFAIVYKKMYFISLSPHVMFAVPHGRSYTAFEKLFGPFERSLLEMHAFVVIVTCVVVLILSFANRKVRAFVYGRGVSTPLLNAIAILFGGSVPQPPVRNFARTLLFLWLVYCFIIGSLYQGSLFHYLQKPMHYPPLKTMREIDRSGLFYYMVDIGTRFFVHNPSIVRRTRIIAPGKDSLGHAIAQVGLTHLTDGVILSPMDLVAYNNRVNPRTRFVHIAREHVSVFPVGLYYPKRSPLWDVFDKQVRMIVPSGLVGDWIKRYGDYDFFARPKEKSEPRKLSNEHLAGAYQLYGCCLGVSVVVFLLEMVSPRFPTLGVVLRHLID